MDQLFPPSPQTPATPPPERNNLVIPLLATLIGISLGGGYFYLKTTFPAVFDQPFSKIYQKIIKENQQYAAQDTQEPVLAVDITPTPTPRPNHSPYPLIPNEGTAGTFKITHAANAGPKITDLRLDPLDAQPGTQVTITVTLTHNKPILSSRATITFENHQTTTSNLSQLSRTGSTEIWSGTYTVTGDNLYTYLIDINSSADDGSSTLRIGLRN